MAQLQAGSVRLGWREWGDGETVVLFVHGNLACKDWLELSAPLFPRGLRVIGVDWRGCGESDRPAPTEGYANYSMQQHADDMIAALDTLGVDFCHLATHSTGGIIATRMMLAQPARFGKVLALDPVSPLGLPFGEPQVALFRAMMGSRELTRTVMATAAASLFVASTLAPGAVPGFRPDVGASAALFERIAEQAFGVSEGVWLGTPHQLNLEHERRELEPLMPGIPNEHLVLWGEQDGWIPADDLRMMAAKMPNCRLVSVPGIGHSMNLEQPALYAGYFGAFFGGLHK
jgi:pimeloyl-ACP methyl ester carboxylesterase